MRNKVNEAMVATSMDINTQCSGNARNSDDEANDAHLPKPALNVAVIKENLMQKYESRRGKQLYIRLPHRIPETEEILGQKIKALSPAAIKVHKPRQKHARFCLVDYENIEDRDKAYNDLKAAIRNNTLAKYRVLIPRHENDEFLHHLAERRLKVIENRKAKLRLKKAIKKTEKLLKTKQQHTTTIIVRNLPEFITFDMIREHFPNAIDIHINRGKSKLGDPQITAAVTLPTTKDAHEAVKSNSSICGKPVDIRYDSKSRKTKNKFKKTQ